MGLLAKNDFYYFFSGMDYYLLDIHNSYWYHVDESAIKTVRKATEVSTRAELAIALQNELGEELSHLYVNNFMQLVEEGAFSSNSKPLNTYRGLDRLSNFILHVSNTCNLGCRYCYGHSGNYGMEETLMSIEVGRRCVDFAIEHCKKDQIKLAFFGGEPLLNFDTIKQIVEYAETKERKFKYSFTTNGTIYNNEIIEFFNKHKFVYQISLDGDKETHDFLRKTRNGQPTYEQIINLINMLKERHYPIPVARLTYTHFNPKIASLATHLEGLGVPSIAIVPVTATLEDEWGLTRDDLTVVYEEIEKMYHAYKEALYSNKEYKISDVTKWLNRVIYYNKSNFVCGTGTGMLAITTDGELYPCHRFVGMQQFSIGHIDQGINFERLSEIVRTTVDFREGCRDCWARYFCGGGCIQQTAQGDGSFGTPYSIHCLITQKYIQEAVKLYWDLLEHGQHILAKLTGQEKDDQDNC